MACVARALATVLQLMLRVLCGHSRCKHVHKTNNNSCFKCGCTVSQQSWCERPCKVGPAHVGGAIVFRSLAVLGTSHWPCPGPQGALLGRYAWCNLCRPVGCERDVAYVHQPSEALLPHAMFQRLFRVLSEFPCCTTLYRPAVGQRAHNMQGMRVLLCVGIPAVVCVAQVCSGVQSRAPDIGDF